MIYRRHGETSGRQAETIGAGHTAWIPDEQCQRQHEDGTGETLLAAEMKRCASSVENRRPNAGGAAQDMFSAGRGYVRSAQTSRVTEARAPARGSSRSMG